MGDGDADLADAAVEGGVAGAAADEDAGAAGGVVADLEVGPADAAGPAGADGLEDGLLGGPAAGEVLEGVLAALAVVDLALGVDAAEEELAVLLDHLADPGDLDDVGADAQDLHEGVSQLGAVKRGDRGRF